MVRIGLAGVGRWGRNYIRTIGEVDGAVLVAAASSNPETPAIVPSGCRVVRDWQDLLAADVDAIVIATPPDTHADILLAAVAAGKAVLIEKPLVTSATELAAIKNATTEAIVMVEHTHLFHPAFRALKAETVARGPPLAIRSSAGNTGPYRQDVSVLWDWGPHDVAMALDLVPGLAEVKAARVVERRHVGTVAAERVHLGLRLAGGIDCDIALSTLDARHRWFAVDYPDCTLIYSDREAQPLRLVGHRGAGPDDDGREITVPAGRPLTIAVTEFVAAVRDGKSLKENLALACRVVDVILQCERVITGTPNSIGYKGHNQTNA